MTAFAQTTTDVIRGRIIGPDSQPLADVNVKATSYSGGVVKTATTDRRGQFNIVFVNGEGDYWIDLTKVGFTARRFEVRRLGDEDVLLANGRMTDATARLGATQVVGERDRKIPSRGANDPDVGGGDRSVSTGNVDPGQEGNLAAMAAGLAGFQMIPGLDGAADAFSALGLSGDQNNTTFAGLGSGVNTLPPDILATTSIDAYPFDVSLGGFSGAQITIRTIPGTNFSRRAITIAGVPPQLEWGTSTALAQGQRNGLGRIGGNAAGPIATDKAFYNLAYNVQRRANNFQTLVNTDPLGLAAAGVSPDSATRLIDVLRGNGIPYTLRDGASLRTIDVAQVAGNVDVSPSGSGAGHSFTIGGAANVQRTDPVTRGTPLLSTPSHAADTRLWGANATLVHTNYFWFGILSRTTLGASASGTSSSPYESIPEGIVRVSSTLPDGTVGVKALSFGGAQAQSRIDNQAIQLANTLTWYTEYNKHAFKVTSSITRDRTSGVVNTNPFGTFTYNSLADIEAQRPASFTRTLNAVGRSNAQVSGSLSFGDAWRPSDGLQIQYGVRADGNRFLVAPDLNPQLASALGVSNDAVPNRVYVSPRIGMQWFYGKSSEVAVQPGGVRPPRAVIHAGVGVFQNIAQSQLINSAITSTGLASATRTVTCIGGATPTPGWNVFAANPSAIPDRCVDGTSGTPFANAAPDITLFDSRFRQPRSIRGAADWSGPIADNRFVLGVQTIISSGRDQSGLIDVNFNPTARFTLPGEGDRPVYVDPSAIIPSTGAVAIAASRRAPAFQHVWDTRSDFSVRSRQFTVNLKPIAPNPWLRWEATYTLLDVHETASGFTSTAGNPLDAATGASLLPGRHVFQLYWYDLPIRDVVYVTLLTRFTSSQRFTPMVAGDVNGDGTFDDRAFIEDSPNMRALLANATPSVRACLESQLGAVAARGSCAAPWTVSSALNVKFNPQKIGLPKRATVTLSLANPVALADLALHGTSASRGWGQNFAPDQNLLYVRGFDPTSRRFIYEVNQRFGSTRPQDASTYALPVVSLSVSVDIAMPRERQLLTQALNVGRQSEGMRATALALAGFGLRSVPNPMSMLLTISDSLKLSRAQADSLAQLNRAFITFAESLWVPVGRSLAALPAQYSTVDAFAQYSAARARSFDYLITLTPNVIALLTQEQRRKVPAQISNFLDERVLRFLRTSSVGDASSVVRR